MANKYSESFQREAMLLLMLNKYNYAKTAKMLGESGVTMRTLRNWEKAFTKNKGDERWKAPELLERAIEMVLARVPETFEASDWGIVVGILFDKWLLLNNKPTVRSESIMHTVDNASDQEKNAIIAEAERILAEATGGGVANSDAED